MNTTRRGAVMVADVTVVYSPAKKKVQSGAAQSRQSGWQCSAQGELTPTVTGAPQKETL